MVLLFFCSIWYCCTQYQSHKIRTTIQLPKDKTRSNCPTNPQVITLEAPLNHWKKEKKCRRIKWTIVATSYILAVFPGELILVQRCFREQWSSEGGVEARAKWQNEERFSGEKTRPGPLTTSWGHSSAGPAAAWTHALTRQPHLCTTASTTTQSSTKPGNSTEEKIHNDEHATKMKRDESLTTRLDGEKESKKGQVLEKWGECLFLEDRDGGEASRVFGRRNRGERIWKTEEETRWTDGRSNQGSLGTALTWLQLPRVTRVGSLTCSFLSLCLLYSGSCHPLWVRL